VSEITVKGSRNCNPLVAASTLPRRRYYQPDGAQGQRPILARLRAQEHWRQLEATKDECNPKDASLLNRIEVGRTAMQDRTGGFSGPPSTIRAVPTTSPALDGAKTIPGRRPDDYTTRHLEEHIIPRGLVHRGTKTDNVACIRWRRGHPRQATR
jgi:hypothetical protein